MAVDTDLIRIKMIERGISNFSELSELSEVNRNTISDIINNKSRPSATTMDKLYKVLELTPEEGGRIFFGQKLT